MLCDTAVSINDAKGDVVMPGVHSRLGYVVCKDSSP